jgi:hypothetical protein
LEEKMTEGTHTLYEKALELSANVPDNFPELGRALTQLYDRDPELFRQLAAKSNMGLRKAYYLVEVSRRFEPLAIPRDQLCKIGWPRLQLIAKHVSPNTLDALLQLAEDTTVKDLECHVRGWEKPAGNAHRVLRYFSPKQYKQLEGALVKHRAVRTGRGIENEKTALLGMVAAANDEPINKTASDQQAKVLGRNGVKP